MKQLRWVLILVAFLTTVLTCKGGWVISEHITDNFGNTTFQTTYIQQNQIRFDGASSISILHLNEQLITIIFPNTRAYWQGSPNDLTNAMIEAYDSQVKTLVLSLPYDQQEAFQQMYDSIKIKMLHPDTTRIVQEFTLIKTDSIKDVNGFSAQAFHLLNDSIIKQVIWFTNEIQPYGEVDANLFVEMSNQINAYSHRGVTIDTDEYLQLLSTGLILKSIKKGQRDQFLMTEVTEVKEVNIPIDFFLPPPNYRKVSLADAFTLPIVDPEADGNY